MTQADSSHKWKVLSCVLFGIFLVVLDTTAINVAFPTLRSEFDATIAQAQWILSIYVLALGIATPAAGFLADRYGIKRIYLAGLGIFVVGSALCGIAPGLWTLVGARASQGIGGGLAIPLGTAQLFRAFPPREQGTAFGIFGMAMVVAPAAGPVLGGWLVDAGLWRVIFLLNLPIGGLGLLLGVRWLNEQRNQTRPPWDVAGLITALLGFGALLYAATFAEAYGWLDPRVLSAFGAGAVVLALFAFVELRRATYPLLELRLFASRDFLVAALIGYVTVVALYGAEFLLPLYLQTLRGEAALRTGLIMLPLAIASGIVLPLAGRLYDRIGPRPLIVAGFVALAVNTWEFAQLDATTPVRDIVILLAIRGCALGLTVQTTLVAALAAVRSSDLPRGSALINSTRQVIQAIGVALLATIVGSALPAESRIAPAAAEAPAVCIDAAAPPAADVAGRASIAHTSSTQSAPESRACSTALAGFSRAYMLTFILAVMGMLLGFLLPGWPAPWTGRAGGSVADPPAP